MEDDRSNQASTNWKEGKNVVKTLEEEETRKNQSCEMDKEVREVQRMKRDLLK